jgi:hypothetical protein
MSPTLQRALEAAASPTQQADGYRDVADPCGHLGREGACSACGVPLEIHYGKDNAFLGCILAVRRHGRRDDVQDAPGGVTQLHDHANGSGS